MDQFLATSRPAAEPAEQPLTDPAEEALRRVGSRTRRRELMALILADARLDPGGLVESYDVGRGAE